MELSVLSCFLIAVWYWVINCDLGNLGRALMNPCLNGVLFGLRVRLSARLLILCTYQSLLLAPTCRQMIHWQPVWPYRLH